MIVIKIIVFLILLIISFIDIKKKEISNISVILLFGFGFFFSNVGARLVSSLITFIFVLFLSMYKDNMGGGDVKLITAMSFYVGFQKSLYTLLLSIICVVIYGKITKRKEVALAPFLSVWFFYIFI